MTAATSLRERLAARPLPTLPFRLLVADPEPTAGPLHAAVRALRTLQIRDDPDPAELAAARQAHDEAQTAHDACWATITFRALTPADYEALQLLHPPTPAQLTEALTKGVKEAPPWDPDTFRPALLAACAVDSDMTADDWAAFLEQRCSSGERQGLYVTALAVNEQARLVDPLVLPKG